MKAVRRLERRRALRAIRAHAAALGHDPGDLTDPRRYRAFLRCLRRATRASEAASVTFADLQVALGKLAIAFAEAMPLIHLRRPAP